MNQSIKIIILALAVLSAIALVLVFVGSIARPPQELTFNNQYIISVDKDIAKVNKNTGDAELDLAYVAILHELRFMWKDSLLSARQHDELKESFVKNYVEGYVASCNRKFGQSVWNESVLKRIQSHINEIQNLTTSDNSIIVGGEVNNSLNEINNVIVRYYAAKTAAGASGYQGWESAKSRIKTAKDYATSSPLCNNIDLVNKLNEVPGRLNRAHVNHLSSCVRELSNYYYYHDKEQFDKLSREIYSEIDSYKKNAQPVYGEVLNVSNIEDIYTQYCRYANEYYSNITVSRTHLSFYSYGGSETITVNCSGTWNVSVEPNSWGHLTRNGNSLTLRVDANNSTSTRTDYFCVKCGSKEIRINVSQSGSNSSSSSSSNTRVTGSVTRLWVDHNVNDEYGNKGMKIHVKFDISGMLNRTGRAVAYFYNSNGNALRDINSSYRTTNGNVSVGQDFVPNYANCTFNDLTMFIPYSELHLTRNTSCFFTVSIWNGNNEVATSSRYHFDIIF